MDTRIAPLGVTPEGQLEDSDNYFAVAWYQHGPAPGEQGRAVFAGHVDSQRGPAVFFDLNKLMPGDEIAVVSGGGGPSLVYVVRESGSYSNDAVPLDAIFGPSRQSELVLMTCEGPFDPNAGGYLQRRLVFAELRAD